MNSPRKENLASGTGMASAISEAQSVIEAAQQRAEEISAEAQRSFERARENGYREGYEQGVADASRKAVRLIQESTKIADNLAEQAAQLALAIAGIIIGEHIKVDGSAAKNIARRAIQESVIGDNVTLVTNPEDSVVINQSLDQLRRAAGSASIRIETDSSISRGGCIVRTDFGEIDATIETLLDSIRERLGLLENV